MLSDTLCNKSIAFSFKATELTLDVILSAIDKLLQNKTKEKIGKQSIKNLRKKGNLQYIEITDESLKKLKKYLLKYNIDYSILKETSDKKQFMLFFKTYDAELLEKIMQKFLAERFKYTEKTSIKDKIKRIKQKNNKDKIQNIKTQKKEKGEIINEKC